MNAVGTLKLVSAAKSNSMAITDEVVVKDQGSANGASGLKGAFHSKLPWGPLAPLLVALQKAQIIMSEFKNHIEELFQHFEA